MAGKTHRVLIISEGGRAYWGGLKGTIEFEFPSAKGVIEINPTRALQLLREQRWDVVITEVCFSESPDGCDVAPRSAGAWIWKELNEGRLSRDGSPPRCFVATANPQEELLNSIPEADILPMPFDVNDFLSVLDGQGFQRGE